MNIRVRALAAALAFAQAAAVIPQGAPPPPPRVATDLAPEVQALAARLLTWARSRESTDHQALLTALADRSVLDLLDPPDVRDLQRPIDLQLARILEQLRTSGSPLAPDTLAGLVGFPTFATDETRQELLVRAMAIPGQLPVASLRFLDRQASPGSVNLQPAITTLCINGSRPALDLVGRKLSDVRFPRSERMSWLRHQLLGLRRSEPFLEWASAWLASTEVDPILREGLVEVIFDYQPAVWFPTGDDLVRPPSEEGLNLPTRRALVRLAQQVAAGSYPASIQTLAKRVADATSTE